MNSTVHVRGGGAISKLRNRVDSFIPVFHPLERDSRTLFFQHFDSLPSV